VNPEEMAAQALADLEAKAQTHLASIRANAAAAKERLEQGVLNLRTQAEAAAPVEVSSLLSDEGWGFDLTPEPSAAEEPAAMDYDPATFAQELGIATDEDGIPLPE
jgi:hypothetical protein